MGIESTHMTRETMWAAFVYGKLDVRVDRVSVPTLEKPDDVLIQVTYTGVCGSDLHSIEGYDLSKGSTQASVAPWPLGHEYSGIVAEVGPAVHSIKPGQRVTVLPRGPCGKCDLCRAGVSALCRRVTHRGGSWAERIVAPEQLVYALPENVPDDVAAITEPLSCALRIVDRCGLRTGENMCVIGAGPLGLLSAVLAKHAGAARVIISDLRESRRQLAARMGIDVVVNPSQENLREIIMDLTGGRGVEISMESVGLEPALSQAIQLVAIGGTVMWAGLAPTHISVPISPNDMFTREFTLRTSWGGVLEYERAIRMEQAIEWGPIVQEKFPLGRAMDAVKYARTLAAGKVILTTNIE
jgi:threonine dehydrogenase-like Zn-dependent dehydrogenase